MDRLAINIGEYFFGGGHFLRSLPGLGTLVSVFTSNAIVIAGVVFLFLLVFAGIRFISAGGDPQKIAQAWQVITYAIIGFIIVIASYLIVRVVEAVLGLSILG